MNDASRPSIEESITTQSQAVAAGQTLDSNAVSSMPSKGVEVSLTSRETASSTATAQAKQPDLYNDKRKEGKKSLPNAKPNMLRKPSVSKKWSSISKKLACLSTVQRQKVDSAFEAMFGYSWGTTPVIASARRRDSRYYVLRTIFGPKPAAQILYDSKEGDSVEAIATKTSDAQLVSRSNQAVERSTPRYPTSTNSSRNNDSESTTASLTSGTIPSRKERGSTSSSSVGGVDALLQQIQGQKNTSTILKTAMDWENFKQESGTLGEKLEQHAESKGAYLKRQDFLTRVDHRQFEQERQERELARGKKS